MYRDSEFIIFFFNLAKVVVMEFRNLAQLHECLLYIQNVNEIPFSVYVSC